MKRPLLSMLLTALLLGIATQAQAQDTEVWMRTGVSTGLGHKLELSYDQQFKWMERAVQLDRWQHTASLEYGATPWLDLGVAYRITAKPSDLDPEDVCCKHRPSIEATAKHKWGRLRGALRLRQQALIADAEDTAWTSRARLKLGVVALKWLRPYVSAETFMLPTENLAVESQRLDVGLRVDVLKDLRLKAYARRELVVEDDDITIMGLNLDYRW